VGFDPQDLWAAALERGKMLYSITSSAVASRGLRYSKAERLEVDGGFLTRRPAGAVERR
jgi:hypothetical protein